MYLYCADQGMQMINDTWYKEDSDDHAALHDYQQELPRRVNPAARTAYKCNSLGEQWPERVSYHNINIDNFVT